MAAGRPKVIFKNQPAQWTIRLIDPSGQAVDAAITPTVTVKKFDGAQWVQLADVVSVIRVGVGEYDCTYTPVDPNEKSDQYGIDEAAQIDLGDGLKWYYNSWEYTIVSEEVGKGIRDVLVKVVDTDTNAVANAVVNVLDNLQNPLNFRSTTRTDGTTNFSLDDAIYYFQISALAGYDSHIPEQYQVTEANTTPTLTLTVAAENGTPEEEPDPNAIDQSGLKRVRTKHMEVEAFDPRIMQEVRDREVGPVSFCDVQICKAVPKRTRKVGCRCN